MRQNEIKVKCVIGHRSTVYAARHHRTPRELKAANRFPGTQTDKGNLI